MLSMLISSLEEQPYIPRVMEECYPLFQTIEATETTIRYKLFGKALQKFDYQIHDEMIYQKFDFYTEWKRGFVATLWIPIASLVRKVFVPIILSIPCIRSQLSPSLKSHVEFVMEEKLPLKDLIGVIDQFCLSILWLITLGLLSPWINLLRGDVERWENGHVNNVDCLPKRIRLETMPYFMPCHQPIAELLNPTSEKQPIAQRITDNMIKEFAYDVKHNLVPLIKFFP